MLKVSAIGKFMDLATQIKNCFLQAEEANKLTAAALTPTIIKAADVLITSLKHGGKILCCGNGGSASDADHFVAELVNRFQSERVNLPAIALAASSATLTAIANDYAYAEVFARQVKAFGQARDVLLAISTSGNSPSVLRAISAAHAQKMQVVALTGKTGGDLAALLSGSDVELRVPVEETPRIQEQHILIIHLLCYLIDEAFKG